MPESTTPGVSFPHSLLDTAPAVARNLGRLVAIIARRFSRDRCSRVAGALAFTTVLAVVPLTAVGIAVLSVFPVFGAWMTAINDFIYGNFVPAAGDSVSSYLGQFAANAGRLTAWGLLFLFVTAVMLIATIEQAFNDIWHVRRQRKLVRRVMAYWAVVTLGPVLMGLSLTITSYLASLPMFTEQPALGGVRQGLLKSAPVVFECVTFVLLYVVVPNVAVRLRYAFTGALVATILFEAAKFLFAVFVTSFANYRAIYGAVAALPVFLIWIYLSWVVTLLGAEVTAALPHWRATQRVAARDTTRTRSRPGSARRRK